MSAMEYSMPTGGVGVGLAVGACSSERGCVSGLVHSVRGTTREQRGFPSQVLVSRFGRSSVSPFLLGEGREALAVGDGVTGFRRLGRWAVMATGPAAPVGTETETLGGLLGGVAGERLRPVFAAVADPDLFSGLGLVSTPIAEDPIVDLAGFSLAGKRRASIRHSVSSARRAGLSVHPWSPDLAAGSAVVSAAWLSTKRGGQMGFTLGRFDPSSFGAL